MSPLRLLSIEDDAKVAALICRVAHSIGFEAHTVHGEDVMRAYRELNPDVIVLDILMPDMDGIEVLRYLREQDCRAHIIMLSGCDGVSRRLVDRMGISLGFVITANMTKPFRVPVLRRLLEETKCNVLAEQQNMLSKSVG